MSWWEGSLYECQCFKEWTILFFIGVIIVIILVHLLNWLFNRRKKAKENNEKSLRDICKELNIPWTDNPDDIQDMINNKLDEALDKEKRRKDL